MEAQSELERKELLEWDNRLMTLLETVAAFKGNGKALKAAGKLIQIEHKALKNCQSAVKENDLAALDERYEMFTATVKKLTKGDKQAEVDLVKMTEFVASEIAELERENEPEPEPEEEKQTAQKVVEKVTEGAKQIGEKMAEGVMRLSEIVKVQVDKIKNYIAEANKDDEE